MWYSDNFIVWNFKIFLNNRIELIESENILEEQKYKYKNKRIK